MKSDDSQVRMTYGEYKREMLEMCTAAAKDLKNMIFDIIARHIAECPDSNREELLKVLVTIYSDEQITKALRAAAQQTEETLKMCENEVIH